MNCRGIDGVWAAAAIAAVGMCLTLGCDSSTNKSSQRDSPGVATKNNGSNSDTPAIEINAAATDSSGNKSDEPTTSGVNGQTGYSPIFEDGLQQSIISSRMDNNFNVFFGRGDKKSLHLFKSAGLRMNVPGNLKVAERYTGLERPGISISISTNPFSMEETTKKIIDEAVNQENTGVLYTRRIAIDGYKGLLYANVATGAGDEAIKIASYTVAVGDESFSWLAKGAFDAKNEMQDQTGELILSALLSMRIADEPRLPPGEDVDFAFTPNVLKLNDGFVDKVIYTKGATFPTNDITQPIFQAVRFPGQVSESDRRQFAQIMMVPTKLFKVELVSSENEIEIDGLKGYEFLAIGVDMASNEPLQLYSVSLFDNETAYVINAWVSSLNTDNHLKDFKQLARTFRRKDKTQKSVPEVQGSGKK